MGKTRRVFSKEIKAAAVRRMELGATVTEVAQDLHVNTNVASRWRREASHFGELAFRGYGNRRTEVEARNRSVNFRLTDAEFEVLERAFAKGPARSLSDFVRAQVVGSRAQPSLAQIDAKLNKLASAAQHIISALRRFEKS